MKRRAAAALFALLAAAAVLLGAPAPASAFSIIPDCPPGLPNNDDAPTPTMPDSGLTGWLRAPRPIPGPDDPFADHPTTTIAAQYGLGWGTFHTYDLGCGGAALHPDSATGTMIANYLMLAAASPLALWAGVEYAAFHPETWVRVFDPVMERAMAAVRAAVWTPIAPLFFVLLGLYFVVHSRRWQWSKAASLAAVTGMILVGLATIYAAPLYFAQWGDELVGKSLTAVNSSMSGVTSTADTDPADAAIGEEVDAVQWGPWLQGTFCSETSPTAVKYGPLIFKATHLSYSEAATVRADPDGAGQALIQHKEDDFKQYAGEIKDSDPSAYACLTGNQGDERVSAALRADIAAACTLPMLIVLTLLILASYLIFRIATVMAGVMGVFAIHPALHGWIRAPLMMALAALVNTVAFGFGNALLTLGVTTVLDPSAHLPGWLALLLAAALSLVMWVALRPFRRLTHMVRNYSPGDEVEGAARRAGAHLRGLARTTARTLLTYEAAKKGTTAAIAAHDEHVADRVPGDEEDFTRDPEPAEPVDFVKGTGAPPRAGAGGPGTGTTGTGPATTAGHPAGTGGTVTGAAGSAPDITEDVGSGSTRVWVTQVAPEPTRLPGAPGGLPSGTATGADAVSGADARDALPPGGPARALPAGSVPRAAAVDDDGVFVIYNPDTDGLVPDPGADTTAGVTGGEVDA